MYLSDYNGKIGFKIHFDWLCDKEYVAVELSKKWIAKNIQYFQLNN